jgi:hypothetical protein
MSLDPCPGQVNLARCSKGAKQILQNAVHPSSVTQPFEETRACAAAPTAKEWPMFILVGCPALGLHPNGSDAGSLFSDHRLPLPRGYVTSAPSQSQAIQGFLRKDGKCATSHSDPVTAARRCGLTIIIYSMIVYTTFVLACNGTTTGFSGLAYSEIPVLKLTLPISDCFMIDNLISGLVAWH